MSNRFYITTPIYYPNAEPHLGHVYTTICADVLARYHRLVGDDTFFLTGTDEHGIKMVKEAEKQGIDPHTLTERNVRIFKQVWQELEISNDDFIRTTEPRHETAVQKIVQKLLDNGDIYLGSYEGWYDEGQEEFVTETEAKANEYKSAVSGRPLVRYKEPTYFFRLSKYVSRVIQHIESNPEFVQPPSRRNEVLSKLRAGVGDLSISRSTLKWGVPMPNDPGHVVYVWIDALSNYITALGYGSEDDARYRRYWPADLHLIGKEILWFHAVYWPAMLLSLGEPLPRRIFAHGWWTAEGKKMSKSMGNFIDLDRLRAHIRTYGRDALRYYLLRAAPFGNDLDWKEVDFQLAFNELANVVGNCLNRTVRMIHRYRGGALPPATQHEPVDDAVIAATQSLAEQIASAYARIELQQCALLPVELARTTNAYIDSTAPFALAKDPSKSARLDTVLNRSAQAIYRALVALLPILPEKSAQGLAQLGLDVTGRTLGELLNSELGAGQVVSQGTPLFPRINPGD